MASLALPLNNALQYSNQFDYPLTLDELWFWQIGTRHSKSKIQSQYRRYRINQSEYYALAGRGQLVPLRHHREQVSSHKWSVARNTVARLSKIPTISAIFVTGALAMNNCPPNDDVDLMIVTQPHTLWLTRLLVYLLLDGHRRPSQLPEHSSPRVSDTICDNLYLDQSHVALRTRSVYSAHEVLQAKCMFDRANVAHMFLNQNAWIHEYLPVAYVNVLKSVVDKTTQPPRQRHTPQKAHWLLALINFICFVVQYLYMKSKITHERISLHTAFFHPRVR